MAVANSAQQIVVFIRKPQFLDVEHGGSEAAKQLTFILERCSAERMQGDVKAHHQLRTGGT